MGFTLTQSVSPKPFTCTTPVWTNVVQFLISKGTFGSGFFFCFFNYKTSNLVLRLVLWISKTFGSNHFQKKLKVGLV
jgi:hypothetical protein